MKYQISDDQVSETIEADDMQEAKETAIEIWQNCNWGEGRAMIDLCVVELDENNNETDSREYVSVKVGENPSPPACIEDKEHEWRSPYSCVGGIKENPGVWSGGGTIMHYKECCKNCGVYKKETLYGVQRNPGQCDVVSYEIADEDSLKWIERRTKNGDE